MKSFGVRFSLVAALTIHLSSSPAQADPWAELSPDTILPSASIGYLEGGTSGVSPAGEFLWSLPLVVPPGRNGFQPNLSIGYRSGGNNGWLGVGFSLNGLSEIQRCGQSMTIDGQTRGIDFSYGDRFCLDGQRLILISGDYGHSGSEYRAEHGGFDKIVYWEGGLFVSSAFDVWTKDGRILRYESFPVAKAVPNPNIPYNLEESDLVYPLWVLKEEKDRAGNRVEYQYTMLDPPAGEDFVLEYLLDKIVYGTPDTPKRSVQFLYEDRWDKSFTWLSGVRIQNTKRLQAIEMRAPNPETIETVQRYAFEYTNSPSTQRSLLHTIYRCNGLGACLWGKEFLYEGDSRPDFDIVSLPEFEFPDIHFQKQDDTGLLVFDADGDGRDDLLYRLGANYVLRGKGADGTPLGTRLELDPFSTMGQTGIGFENILVSQSRAVDLDGDGKSELWGAQLAPGPQYHVFEWNGNALTLASTDWFWGPVNLVQNGPAKNFSFLLEAVQFGDANGDGTADIFFQDTGSGQAYWDIFLNATGGNAGTIYWPNIPAECGHRSKLLDINGDGRVEIWSASNIQCSESIWMGLDENDQPVSAPLLGFPYEARKALWGDLNGDGLQDMLRPGNPGWIRFATGNGYGPKVAMINGPDLDGNATDNMDQGNHVVDINHDGLDDLFVFRIDPYPHIAAYMSLGDGRFQKTELNQWPGQFHWFEGFSTSRIGDFNGDGLLDAVIVSPAGNLNVLLQKPGQVDVLHSIGDHLVAEKPRELIVYSNQIADTPVQAQCAFPQRCLRQGMPVVREHWVWQNGQQGYRKTLYDYQDPRMDMQGQGFLGFATVRERDAERLSETITEFDTKSIINKKYPYAHLPKTVTHIAPIFEQKPSSLPAQMKARITKRSNQYGVHPLNQNKTDWVPLDAWSSEEWEQDVLVSDDKIELLGNAPVLRHREGLLVYDDFGNTTIIESKTWGGVLERTTNTFDIREQDWLISLPATTSYLSTHKPAVLWPEPQVTVFEHDTHGFLHKVSVEPYANSMNLPYAKTWVRDGDGLVIQVIEEAPGFAPRNTFISYEDNERIFVNAVWNDLGFTDSIAVHPAFGLTAIERDMHGVETHYQYDGFGRLLYQKRDGEAGVNFGLDADVINGWARGLIHYVDGEAGDASWTRTDEWGRPLEAGTKSFDGQWSVSKNTYDLLGRVIAQSRPDFSKPSPYETQYTFDSLDRLLSVKAPDGVSTNHEHSFTGLTTKAPEGRTQTTYWDIDGRITQNIEFQKNQPLITFYEYGDFDRIEKVTDPEQNETLIQYDRRGRRTLLLDPDQGPKTFVYNGFGELLGELNAQNQWTLYMPDQIGRLTDRIDADGITKFVWDQALPGTLSQAISPDGTVTEFLYDALARPWQAKWNVNGDVYAFETEYDTMGRVSSQKYPEVPGRERFAIEYLYNAQNELEQVRDASTGFAYYTVNARNAEGLLTSVFLGKHLEEARIYEPVTGRLSAIQTLQGVQVVDALEFSYWPGGDLKERNNPSRGRFEQFLYDDLDRLRAWTLDTAAGSKTTAYQYDAIGNLQKVFIDGQLKEHNQYGANGRPHALTSTLKDNYQYDAIGRMEAGGGKAITYTAFDLPKTVNVANGLLWEFGYDALGQRIRKSSDAGTTIRIAELYERRAHGNSIEHVFSVPGEFETVAEVHFDELAQSETILFIHGDALGSSRVVTNDVGDVYQRLYFEPFGQRIEEDGSPIAANFQASVTPGFTGHEHDDAIGLIYMRGRMYDPAIKRFLTPDPVISNALYSQAFNRYSYTFNNPLRFIDPSGFEAEGQDPPACAERALCPIKITFDVSNIRKKKAGSSGPAKSAVKPREQQSDENGYKSPGGAATPTPEADSGKKQEGTLKPESWKDNEFIQRSAGLIAGLILSYVPAGTPVVNTLMDAGIVHKGTPDLRLGKAIGEIIGGIAQIGGGGALAAGGVTISSTGVGVLAGAPAWAISAGLIANGVANVNAGIQELVGALNAQSSGGGSGVSQGPPNAGPAAQKIQSVAPESLSSTHKLTLSRKAFDTLKRDIVKNGVKEPVKYVEHNGTKYIVDGHHRVQAARELGLKEIPAEKVQLPYRGYKSPADLFDWER